MKYILLVWVFGGGMDPNAGGFIHEVGPYADLQSCEVASKAFNRATRFGNSVCVPKPLPR